MVQIWTCTEELDFRKRLVTFLAQMPKQKLFWLSLRNSFFPRTWIEYES